MADAASSAATSLTILGMIMTGLVAIGGWVISNRGQRTDSASALVTAALAISDRHSADEHDCREELAELAQRVDAIAADLADCRDRHARAEQAMAAAGITLPE